MIEPTALEAKKVSHEKEAAKLEKALNEQKKIDIKSILSVIADSARVEVWCIS